MKSISVIVVNFNGRHQLEECLRSLMGQAYGDFETILVDNGSSDGSPEYVEEAFPRVRVIRLSENRGFAGGNIAGLRAAKGEYVALLNTDAVPDARWLEELASGMEQDPAVGICASLLVRRDAPGIVDSAGDGCITSGHGIKRGDGEQSLDYRTRAYVFGACAGAALYRRTMLDDVGFFDGDFFLNCEDTDLNFRAQLMGWKCLYVPSAVVLHGVSTFVGKRSDVGIYHSSRNDEFVWMKNMPLALMIRFLHHKIVQEMAGLAYFCVFRGKWGPYLRGKADFVRWIPSLLRKRAEVQSRKRADNGYIKSMLTSVVDPRLVKGKVRKFLGD